MKKHQLNAWELIELIGLGHFTKGINPQTISMGINEIYQELILDVIKQVETFRLLLMHVNIFSVILKGIDLTRKGIFSLMEFKTCM